MLPQHHLGVIDRKGEPLHVVCIHKDTVWTQFRDEKLSKEWPELNIYIDNLGDNQYGSIVNAPFSKRKHIYSPAGENAMAARND